MKSAIAFLALLVTANAFTAPLMATRAVKKAEPVAAPVSSDRSAYPTWAGAQNFKISGISGGGNKAPVSKWVVPDFSDPKLQKERDPAFYAEAAKSRLMKAKTDFAYDDGLTDLERKQRATIPIFLTGSAKSQADPSAISDVEIQGVDYFGLSADRFQLLMISVFGLFTLVGSLSGNLKL